MPVVSCAVNVNCDGDGDGSDLTVIGFRIVVNQKDAPVNGTCVEGRREASLVTAGNRSARLAAPDRQQPTNGRWVTSNGIFTAR